MWNYQQARGGAISTSIKTSADYNSVHKRAAINRKYIACRCVGQPARDYNYAYVHVTPRVSRVIRLCALLTQPPYLYVKCIARKDHIALQTSYNFYPKILWVERKELFLIHQYFSILNK